MINTKNSTKIIAVTSIILIGFILFSTSALGRTVYTSLWITASNGLDIFNTNSGNVGIGTSNPIDKLTIVNTGTPGHQGVTILDGYLQIFFNY